MRLKICIYSWELYFILFYFDIGNEILSDMWLLRYERNARQKFARSVMELVLESFHAIIKFLAMELYVFQDSRDGRLINGRSQS